MSRLSGSPFRKPSPFEFPLSPPSPPETNTDTIVGSGHILPPPQNFAMQDFGSMDAGLQGANSDIPLRVKRSSSIPYHSTTFRDPKERTSPRNTRSLVIVMPPSTLIQENGQHGDTGSNGPYHRLSQGVVMPLFPSIFGQLTAIAKEFNFPSTVGLCLYYHYVEGDLTLKPRISDESWQSLWAHLSDPVGPNERRPPIGGKMEFDIDLRLARWYPNWVASVHRESVDHTTHSAHPSIVASLAHFRAESTHLGGRASEDDTGDNSTFHQHNGTSFGRHVPRKLSLVERFDVASVRSESKPNPRSVAPSAEVVPTSQTLSTILQEDEPKSGREHLDSRVKSWRASALISPTPLAAKGQTSLDPSNLPNNIPINTSLDVPGSPSDETETMNLEDFTWSVTSAGPQSCGELSPVSWVHAPSVHLAQRLQGSVCTSPSTCTSFGPDEEDAYSYVSTSSRIASIHLAERLQGSVCTSPSTCTSFGRDDDDYISYTSPFSRIPTPDIAHRYFEDCPLTPMTSTSWGAPLSYPPSPGCYSPTPSLDLGERSRFHDGTETVLTVSNATPWQHVWPYNSHILDTMTDPSGLPMSSYDVESVKPWPHVWPYNSHILDTMTDPSGLPMSSYDVESVKPWPHVWPYFNSTSASVVPLLEQSSEITLSVGYPYINIYRPVYPHLEIYPTLPPDVFARTQSKDRKNDEIPTIDVKMPVSYPIIEIYRPVYPYNLDLIYPEIAQEQDERKFSSSQVEYPFFNIYPAVIGPSFAHFSLHMSNPHSQYPDFDIYPSSSSNFVSSSYEDHQADSELSTHIQTYPFLNIYPAVYPHFDIYPAVEADVKETRLTSRTSHSSTDNRWNVSLNIVAQGIYPFFNLYPAVYPYFDIYPACSGNSSSVKTESESNVKFGKSSLSPILPTSYPSFNLYPAVYPDIDIYPAPYDFIIGSDVEKELVSHSSLSPTLPPSYPSFNLYPSVYPYLTIYPAPFGEIEHVKDQDSAKRSSSVLISKYPYFNLYPAVYPYFDIYPSPYFGASADGYVSETFAESASQTHDLPYPFFNLYPAVYPHFDLYLPRPMTSLEPPRKRSKPKSRLTHLELHAMVMMERATLEGSNANSRHDFSLHDFQMHSVPQDLDGNISNYMQETAAANVARNKHISTSNMPIPTRELRKSVPAHSSGSAIFLSSSAKGQQETPSLRRMFPSKPPLVSRSSSLREPVVKPPIPPRQSPMGPSRRDSLVLQRAKAFDQPGNSNGISKETLSRFPMPPRSFPPLPPLPQDRKH